MISHQYKTIFIHIRKAAGTSIIDFYSKIDKNLDVKKFNNINDLYEISNYNDYYKFTIVRNPYDRFISAHNYLKCINKMSINELLNNMPRENLIINILKATTINAALQYLKLTIMQFINGRGQYKKGHHYRHLSAKQVDYIFLNNKVLVDEIFYFENISKYFSTNLKINNYNFIKLEHKNKNDNKNQDFMSNFTDEDIILFNNIFLDDLILLGYENKSKFSKYDIYKDSI
jgi:hypothetical protein